MSYLWQGTHYVGAGFRLALAPLCTLHQPSEVTADVDQFGFVLSLDAHVYSQYDKIKSLEWRKRNNVHEQRKDGLDCAKLKEPRKEMNRKKKLGRAVSIDWESVTICMTHILHILDVLYAFTVLLHFPLEMWLANFKPCLDELMKYSKNGAVLNEFNSHFLPKKRLPVAILWRRL